MTSLGMAATFVAFCASFPAAILMGRRLARIADAALQAQIDEAFDGLSDGDWPHVPADFSRFHAAADTPKGKQDHE